jgi:hypothetical protein
VKSLTHLQFEAGKINPDGALDLFNREVSHDPQEKIPVILQCVSDDHLPVALAASRTHRVREHHAILT